MHKTNIFMALMGKLIRSERSKTMDQSELAVRTGVSRSTISAMENGRNVSVESLSLVLEHLNLLDEFIALLDDELKHEDKQRLRKSKRKTEWLDNDF